MHGSLVAILISFAPQIPKGLALTLFVCSHKLVMVPKTIKKLLLENEPGVIIKFHYFKIKVAVHPLQPKLWSPKRLHGKKSNKYLRKAPLEPQDDLMFCTQRMATLFTAVSGPWFTKNMGFFKYSCQPKGYISEVNYKTPPISSCHITMITTQWHKNGHIIKANRRT